MAGCYSQTEYFEINIFPGKVDRENEQVFVRFDDGAVTEAVYEETNSNGSYDYFKATNPEGTKKLLTAM